MIASVEIGMGVSMQQHSDMERHHMLGLMSSDHTTVGFVLSNPDHGDIFDVDVFMDPQYGTFIFHMMSGRSLCLHKD